jgi:predicted dehydrogenase
MVKFTGVGDGQCEVVLVGCGVPKRGMGWYHTTQLMKGQIPSGKLCYIVEPWFLGPGANGPGGAEFGEYKAWAEKEHGVQFYKALADLPAVTEGKKRLALISGRTADNPRFLSECIAAACNVVYLEKPGAPSVAELGAMREEAEKAAVPVKMGYNKNVCKYVRKAREYAAEHGGHITFISNNTYENTPASLGECFERNAEGMLKNMAIHELALLVTFFDVTVENIESVETDKDFSSCQTLKGPSGKEFTDFDKIKFTIKTKTGKSVSVQADRCGGNTSFAKVDDDSGKEVFRYAMPDDEDKATVEKLEKEYPGVLAYLIAQDPDYITLKERICNFCANGVEPEGVATIDIAYETLRVAEHLTPTIQEQLK